MEQCRDIFVFNLNALYFYCNLWCSCDLATWSNSCFAMIKMIQ